MFILVCTCRPEIYNTNHYGFMTSCMFHFCRSEAEKLEIETLKKIRDCTKKVGKSGIETTAYLHALANEKKLNVDKYRDQVKKELESH